MRELGKRGVQAELKKAVAAYGGMVENWVRSGRIGPPDCIVTWPGVIDLVETKRPKNEGGRVRAAQTRDHARRGRYGIKVYIVWSKDEAWAYAKQRAEATRACGTVVH